MNLYVVPPKNPLVEPARVFQDDGTEILSVLSLRVEPMVGAMPRVTLELMVDDVVQIAAPPYVPA